MATQTAQEPHQETPAEKPGEEGAKSLEDLKDENGKILGKFDSEADLAKAYEESQKKISELSGQSESDDGDNTGETGGEESDDDTGDDNEQEVDSPYDEGTTELLTGAGLDPTEVAQTFDKNGELSEEQYKALEETYNVPRKSIDAHVEAIKSQREQQKAEAEGDLKEIQEVAGGEESYKSMIDWASENFSEEEAEEFNAAVESGNKHIAKLAVKGLKQKFEAAKGKKPKTLKTGGGKAPKADVFENAHQLREAQKDKRYGKDPDYTRYVQEKAMRSSVFTTDSR